MKRVGWGGVLAFGFLLWGCDDAPGPGMETVPDPTPIHQITFSDSLQVSVESELGPGGRGDLRVELILENPTGSPRSVSFGPCFFIVRIYGNAEPSGSAIWDHRPPQGGGCFDGETTLTVPVGESLSLKLIPDFVPGYNRALPSGRHALWVLLHQNGRVVPVPAGELDL